MMPKQQQQRISPVQRCVLVLAVLVLSTHRRCDDTILGGVDAWSQQSSPSVSTRNAFLQDVTKCVVGATTVGMATLTTSKVDAADAADLVTSQLAAPAAVRNIKLGLKKLNRLRDLVDAKEYALVSESLRVPPLSEIRKSCGTVIAAAGENPVLDASPGPVTTSYKVFISKLEKLDSDAKIAVRGRTLPDQEFGTAYQQTLTSLQDFITLAEEKVLVKAEEEEPAVQPASTST